MENNFAPEAVHNPPPHHPPIARVSALFHILSFRFPSSRFTLYSLHCTRAPAFYSALFLRDAFRIIAHKPNPLFIYYYTSPSLSDYQKHISALMLASRNVSKIFGIFLKDLFDFPSIWLTRVFRVSLRRLT